MVHSLATDHRSRCEMADWLKYEIKICKTKVISAQQFMISGFPQSNLDLYRSVSRINLDREQKVTHKKLNRSTLHFN